METYQHAVFFEANNLSNIELRQIQNYFQIKRKSGGGDCEILKVGANTYKINFRDKNGKLMNFSFFPRSFINQVNLIDITAM